MIMSHLVFQVCRKEFKQGILDADRTAARVNRHGERTIRRWRTDFIRNGGEFHLTKEVRLTSYLNVYVQS
jgi:hypothetical protein